MHASEGIGTDQLARGVVEVGSLSLDATLFDMASLAAQVSILEHATR